GVLTEMVLADELDFAVVPAFEGRTGLKSRLLVRDREMLLSGSRRGLRPLAPVRLADCAPLKIVVPARQNVRRRNLETYFQTHGAAARLRAPRASTAGLARCGGVPWRRTTLHSTGAGTPVASSPRRAPDAQSLALRRTEHSLAPEPSDRRCAVHRRRGRFDRGE